VLAAIVDRCLQKTPADRYPTAAALGDDLRRVTAAGGERLAIDDRTRTTMRAAAAGARAARFPRRVVVLAGCAIALLVTAWLGGPSLLHWLRNRGAATSAAPDADAGASPQELYRAATERLRVYYREGNVDRAIAQLERALQQQREYPLAEARLSLAYWRKNNLSPDEQWQKQVRAHADRAVAGDPQLAVAHMAQGVAFFLRGDYGNASAAYQRAATLDASNYELLWRMGDLAVARKEPDATTEALYRRSTDAAPNQWEPLARLGGFYYRRGRYADAVPVYQKARALAPDHPRMASNLAAVFHHLGRTDEAAAVLQQSLEIAPDSITYSNLGTLLYFQGKYPEALSAFERAVQRGANTYLYWGNLGDAARMTPGGSDKAHEAYTRAVQLARAELARTPDDVDARSSAAVYLIRDGQAKAALAEIHQVLAAKSIPPAVLFKAALVTELAGQRARALDLLGRALAAGYQLGEIAQEPDFVTLRTDPQYHKLASRYEK
jgi:tetratricopeptide (TPR) repeat protein